MSWCHASRRAVSLLALLAIGSWSGGTAQPAHAQAVTPASAPLAPDCIAETEVNDQPEQAPEMRSAICVTGTLPERLDQDLILWTVEPAEALITWRITVVGIPTTITSVHVFDIRTEPGVFPIDAREFLRVDSSATDDTPGVETGVSLRAGTYLLGISRGDPAKGPPAPPGEYRVSIERELELPPNGDVEPNDDTSSATPIRLPFSLVGDGAGTPDLFRWTVTDDEADIPVQLDLRTVAGDSLRMRLLDAAGAQLAVADVQRDGYAHLYDLVLPAADYLVEIAGSGAGPLGYVLSSGTPTDPAADAEPNDGPEQALSMDIGDTRTGRLAGARDIDHYRVSIPADAAGRRLEVAVRVSSAEPRRLCLIGPDLDEIQCRSGRGDIVLSNLVLASGDHLIEVDGTEDTEHGYRLSVVDAGPVAADHETEPNDLPDVATPFDPSLVMHGRSANGDDDHYMIEVTGEPTVWRLDVTGTGIRDVLWIEPDREVRGTADVARDGTSASLWDMYLIPGRHWVMVDTTGEDYTITMTPLGPLAPGTEREPNDDADNAEPLDLGVERTGRLPGPGDTDVVRFSLEAAEHLLLRLEPPADDTVRLRLTTGGTEIMRTRQPVTGEPFLYDAWLEVGDYEVTLTTEGGSIQPYHLLVERGDPWDLPADLEPNDVRSAARDIPAGLVIRGGGFGQRAEDTDWFRIPATGLADRGEVLVVRALGGELRVDLTDAQGSQVGIDPDETRGTWTSRALPPEGDLYLAVLSGGPYELTVAGGGLQAMPAPDATGIGLSLELASPVISAYETFGQRVTGSLAVSNETADDVRVELVHHLSDDRWAVTLDADRLDIAPGATQRVTVALDAPPDAWADVPTRLTIGASTTDGRRVSTAVEVTPDRDGTPVGARQAWPLPDALLGGLDATSLALGASVVSPTFSHVSEESLHDGFALAGAGFSGSISGTPATFTMALASDDPVPVVGLIVDPLAGAPSLAAAPRAFELALSDDGSTWRTVLAGELSPRMAEQSFVLDAPTEARLARLTIASTWSGDRSSLQLGEWQVIARPGWTPGMPLDIASTALGGHVVRAEPGPADPRQPASMLDEIPTGPWQQWLDPDTDVSWVVGFRDGRAGRITELQWVDAVDGDPTERFERVRVAVGTETPLGPWQDIGTWELSRAADGGVAPFRLPDDTWARYVRFTGDGPADERAYREMPAILRILEASADDTYRSITGAWGRNERPAIRELLDPPDLSLATARTTGGDGDDTPETATVLVRDVAADGRIRRGADIDWYRLTVPEGQNTVDLSLAAPPAAGIELVLLDVAGTEVAVRRTPSSDPMVSRWEADVEPGASYLVRLEQPPFSTVFSYDTSGSMGSYLTYVSTALRGFASDVVAGEESVLILPFEDSPLLDEWTDDAYVLEDAVAGVAAARGSSGAEASMLEALDRLAGRRGTHAMLVVTDAETSTYARMGELWEELADERPIIFTVHVGGGGTPQLSTQLMQDWAWSWGGHYEYAASHGSLDRAFDRLATWLRREAAYQLTFGARSVSHEPGRLMVVAPSGPDGGSSVVAGSGVGVEILLDTSGSMLEPLGDARRIDVAKGVLTRLVDDTLPDGLPVALRIFDGQSRCQSELLTPLTPLDGEAMAASIRKLRISKKTRTPIAATLREVAADLAGAEGAALVVLVTDGKESCKGKPGQVIEELVASGLDIRLNIVGFAIDDAGLKEQLAGWAELGGGRSFDAQDADSLLASISQALSAPFRVLDADGAEVASGVVGGQPVPVPPGTYTVEVLASPVIVLDDVVIEAEMSRTITLDPPAP